MGAEKILQQLNEKTDTKRRVGILVEGRAPARDDMLILDGEGNQVGVVTSGRASPLTKENIAMGYIDKPFQKVGTDLQVKIRSKLANCKVVKMPFVPTKYYKAAA